VTTVKVIIAAVLTVLLASGMARADWALIFPPLVFVKPPDDVVVKADTPIGQWKVDSTYPDQQTCELRREGMKPSYLFRRVYETKPAPDFDLTQLRLIESWKNASKCVEVKGQGP
jgi:hypothetical protein